MSQFTRKALFIGGTGTISSAIVRRLSQDPMWEVYLLNRGSHAAEVPENVHQIVCDISDEKAAADILKDMTFDTVCEFIGFVPSQVERDLRLFEGKCRQYIYISSASAYHKLSRNYLVSESTTMANPYWQYSRDKIACEDLLMDRYRKDGFPVTIVRPSHTYSEKAIPVALHGDKGPWQVIQRMLDGKPVIIPGDGTSLWHLTFNEDFAIGFTALMGNPHAIGEIYQITGDEVLTWNQIHEIIADALGVTLKPCHVATDFLVRAGKAAGYDFEGGLTGDKSQSVVFDNRKIKGVAPGMGTHVPFDRGVRIALDYICAHPECRQPDPDFDAYCDRVIDALEKAAASLT